MHSFRPPREFREAECVGCRTKREAEEKKQQEQEEEAKRVGLRAKWRLESGLPMELRSFRFDDLDRKYNPKAQKLCREWAANFDLEQPRGAPSLMLYSDVPGVGKTTLMVCIVNAVLEKWKGPPLSGVHPIRFISGPELVRRIRATYNLAKDDYTHEREEQVYRELTGIRLLLLDDVGKERPTDFTRETYWYIINERMNAGLPIIFNSRLPVSGVDSLIELMGVDTVDRLYGMCRGEKIDLVGPSYRRLHKQP